MAPVAAEPSVARSERAERTRQRILDAAAHYLAANGWAKTTVEAIAARAGVSKGLVYHRFRGKEEILEAVVERTLADWDEACRREGWPESESVLHGLAAMHRCGLAYARDNPLLRALFQLDPLVLLDMRRSAAVRRSLEQFQQELVAAIRAGVESGELRRDLDVERAAEVIRILHLAFVDQLLSPGWIDASDQRLIEASLDVLFHGVAGGGR
jgi:AcrR family transcriptional regulator